MNTPNDELRKKTADFKRVEQDILSDDDLGDEELECRRQSRAFFHKPQKQRTTSSSSGLPDAEDTESGRKNQPRQEGLAKKRVSSAPTPIQPGSRSLQVIKGTPASAAVKRKTGRLGRLLDGASSKSMPSAADEEVVPETARPIPRALRRSDSTPAVIAGKRVQDESLGGSDDTPSRSTAPTKRRRTGSTTKVPDIDGGEKVFKNLSFYYVPDNEIAPARRIRINKAKENGATWTRFPKFATHVVADRNIRWIDIKHMIPTSASAVPVVVNEDYPIDCIQFKAMLDPMQKKYQLVGQPENYAATSSMSSEMIPASLVSISSEDLPSSLPLKPPQRNPKKWDYVPPPNATPDRTSGSAESSSQVSQSVNRGTVPSSLPIVIDLEQEVVAELPSQRGPESNGKIPGNQNTAKSREEVPSPKSESRSKNHGDELSDFIALMQEYKDVPLDDDDAEDTKHSSFSMDHDCDPDEGGSGSEKDRARKLRQKPTRSNANSRKNPADRFACNQAGLQNALTDNPNARTIEVLQKMATYYDQTNDHWRTTAYRKAISTLKRQQVKVTTEDEAFKLPSVGRRLAQKIEEIVTTDRLQKLEHAQMDPRNEILQLFLGIYGVGTSQAQQWIAQGFRTLEDLRAGAKLTPNQLVGIDHYDDLNTKIPRSEVEALGAVVKDEAAKINSKVEMIIGGSYRRGADKSGDIDFIVTERQSTSGADLQPFLDELVKRLTEKGFLVARLASGRAGGGDGGSKWHGCCVLPKPSDAVAARQYRPVWRRIDFLVVPDTEIGAALLYFTGNDIFNRSMRLLASRKGMRLNQRGLYKDVMRGPNRVKVTEGELLEGRDERSIFDILGVKWREPQERWC